mmetsp:Transcript_38296/g.108283  ORF Transcript_38296/g.108283 Transcript_38296/m.108283 type:complete len:302 (+) Transcript_38296:1840-2745(+)
MGNASLLHPEPLLRHLQRWQLVLHILQSQLSLLVFPQRVVFLLDCTPKDVHLPFQVRSHGLYLHVKVDLVSQQLVGIDRGQLKVFTDIIDAALLSLVVHPRAVQSCQRPGMFSLQLQHLRAGLCKLNVDIIALGDDALLLCPQPLQRVGENICLSAQLLRLRRPLLQLLVVQHLDLLKLCYFTQDLLHLLAELVCLSLRLQQLGGLAVQLQLQAVDVLVQGLDLWLQCLPVLIVDLVHLRLQLVPVPLHLYDLQLLKLLFLLAQGSLGLGLVQVLFQLVHLDFLVLPTGLGSHLQVLFGIV